MTALFVLAVRSVGDDTGAWPDERICPSRRKTVATNDDEQFEEEVGEKDAKIEGAGESEGGSKMRKRTRRTMRKPTEQGWRQR
jgi:hypothetical protein